MASRCSAGIPLTALALGLLALGCGQKVTPPSRGVISGVVSDSSGKPLGAVEIETDPQAGAAVTGSEGAYRLELEAGTYLVRASKTGHAGAERTDVRVEAGGTALVDFTMGLASGTIVGKVIDAATRAPISGAHLTTLPACADALSGADGSYRLEPLTPGSYAVKGSAMGYAELKSAAVAVDADGTGTVNLELQPAVVYDSTCLECHLNLSNLVADLTRDPPPAPPGATSEGEG
ncbi:MAG: carboxypeptidase-like regulatory domain-containing protein [Myxococcaceae bacterium]